MWEVLQHGLRILVKLTTWLRIFKPQDCNSPATLVLGLSRRNDMNIPNLITIMRILLVPVTVWLLISESFGLAFLVFILAGISDGVDGFLARRLNMQSELGAYLDPLADKALLVSVYGTLGIIKILPAWLVLMVVTRDILIIGGVLLAWLVDQPFNMKPLMISKLNTVVQISFAGLLLGILGLSLEAQKLLQFGTFIVAAFTIISGAYYLRDWINHMAHDGAAK
jgi:cardiolipin synthase (CMP-forming)